MSKNVTSNLRRMASKDEMVSIGTKLIDSNQIKFLLKENEMLKQNVQTLSQEVNNLSKENQSLAKVIDASNVRVMAIEEEKGIAIGELRVLLQDLSMEKDTMEKQLREEKQLLSSDLKQMIDQLTKENHQLKGQSRQGQM